MPINKKQDKFDCSKIRVIPQISDNTCWFNAMLMIALYSDKSRKLMKKISKKWDEKDSFFRIIKKIMFKLYRNPDKVIPFFKKIQPSLLLLKMFRKFKDKSIIENLRYKLKKNIIEFSWSSNYIVKFYRYLGAKCVDITYNSNTKEAYLNIDKYVNYESNNGTITSSFNLNLFNEDVKNDNFGSEFKKGNNPDVLVLYHQDLNQRTFNRNLKFYNQIKTLATSSSIVDNFSLSTFVKNQKGIGSVANVITLNGVEYELDAVILSNYNKVEKGNHAIAGITCGNEKFVYNGWVSNNIGKEPSPCSLMKLDWDIKKDTKFCLNSSLCKLDLIKNEDTKRWCFSFAKGPRSLIYVKKDKNEEMKTPLISTKAVISNVESIVKDVHLYDLDKYSKTEILGFIKNLGGINLDVSQKSSINKLKEVYFNLVMNYMKKHALITPKDNKKGFNASGKKECPPDKVLNELTQRCVSRTSPLGLKILGLKGSNDKKKVPDGKKDLKECPPDKVLNELTQRCVSRTSPLGLKILGLKGSNDKKKVPDGKKGLKECPPDKVLNELTQRCVSRTSPLGLKILANK
jgi:hypothetical protein